MIIEKRQLVTDQLPRFYGVAWRDPTMLVVHAFPVPFNVVIRWLRGVWAWVKYSHGDRWLGIVAEARHDGFKRGYDAGWSHGVYEGKQQERERISREAGTWLEERAGRRR